LERWKGSQSYAGVLSVMAEAADDQHHFEFDLDPGIREQVVEKLEASPFICRCVDGSSLSLYFGKAVGAWVFDVTAAVASDQATFCILVAKSRPEVGGGNGRPSLR
jgi:hypothetical protein